MVFVEWLMDRVLRRERFDIGRPGEGVYLTRWSLLGKRQGGRWAVYLHRFHRSDNDDALHDHPWPFTSVILWGGYSEESVGPGGRIVRRWCRPGSVLHRPADWRHRVDLKNGRHCWTLVIRGDRQKSWSFFCRKGDRLTGKEVPWRSFIDSLEAGQLGCDDGGTP